VSLSLRQREPLLSLQCFATRIKDMSNQTL
jgi:hypothetical protein